MPLTIEPDTTAGPSENGIENEIVSNLNKSISEPVIYNSTDYEASAEHDVNSTFIESNILKKTPKIDNNVMDSNNNTTTTTKLSLNLSSTTEQTLSTTTTTTDELEKVTEKNETIISENPTKEVELVQMCGKKIGKTHPWIVILEHTDPKGQSQKKTVSKGVLIDRRHVLTTVSSVHNSRPFWTV